MLEHPLGWGGIRGKEDMHRIVSLLTSCGREFPLLEPTRRCRSNEGVLGPLGDKHTASRAGGIDGGGDVPKASFRSLLSRPFRRCESVEQLRLALFFEPSAVLLVLLVLLFSSDLPAAVVGLNLTSA